MPTVRTAIVLAVVSVCRQSRPEQNSSRKPAPSLTPYSVCHDLEGLCSKWATDQLTRRCNEALRTGSSSTIFQFFHDQQAGNQSCPDEWNGTLRFGTNSCPSYKTTSFVGIVRPRVFRNGLHGGNPRHLAAGSSSLLLVVPRCGHPVGDKGIG